jgi:hypothetical protein
MYARGVSIGVSGITMILRGKAMLDTANKRKIKLQK